MIKDQYSGTPLLWMLLAAVAICLAGIGALYVLELPSTLESVLYYLLLALLFVAAISYNIVSFQKGRWLIRKMKEENKKDQGPE